MPQRKIKRWNEVCQPFVFFSKNDRVCSPPEQFLDKTVQGGYNDQYNE
jgi:hypothetical protein